MKRSVCIAVAVLASPCAIAADTVASLVATAGGKPACHSEQIRLPGSRALVAALCVVEHMSGRSEYYAEIEGRRIAGGIDDEVAEGVAGSFQATPLTLRCPAMLKVPNTVPQERIEAMKREMPNGSDDELQRMAITADTAETGRECSLRVANLVELMRVRIWH